MSGFLTRISGWWDDAQSVVMFVFRCLMITVIALLPVIFWLRAQYYNFIVYDESVLSIEIANEMWIISTYVAPLFSVLGKYMLSGLRKTYQYGKGYRASCGVLEWGLNVELIVMGARIVLVTIAHVVSFHRKVKRGLNNEQNLVFF